MGCDLGGRKLKALTCFIGVERSPLATIGTQCKLGSQGGGLGPPATRCIKSIKAKVDGLAWCTATGNSKTSLELSPGNRLPAKDDRAEKSNTVKASPIRLAREGHSIQARSTRPSAGPGVDATQSPQNHQDKHAQPGPSEH